MPYIKIASKAILAFFSSLLIVALMYANTGFISAWQTFWLITGVIAVFYFALFSYLRKWPEVQFLFLMVSLIPASLGAFTLAMLYEAYTKTEPSSLVFVVMVLILALCATLSED